MLDHKLMPHPLHLMEQYIAYGAHKSIRRDDRHVIGHHSNNYIGHFNDRRMPNSVITPGFLIKDPHNARVPFIYK